MIGDKLYIKPEYRFLSKKIFDVLYIENFFNGDKKVIAIGGESGSGKSVTAVVFSQILKESGISNVILHQDDYFYLPPKSNHRNRLSGLENVGMHEVDLDLMQNHISAFKNEYQSIKKPLVKYQENLIIREELNVNETEILIVEGTYVLSFDEVDFKIFIDRDYKETLQQRLDRNREIIDEFSNKVLEIEHNIIKKYIGRADGMIDKNYEFKRLEK